MRLVDADHAIEKLKGKIKNLEGSLEYWELRQKHDRNNYKVMHKARDCREQIADSYAKIVFLKELPTAVMKGIPAETDKSENKNQ